MKQVAVYKRHAEECRQLAVTATVPTHRDQLLEMAKTWEMLAEQREKELARQERLAALSTDTGNP